MCKRARYNNEYGLEEFAAILSKYAPRLRGFTAYPDGSRGGQPITAVDYQIAMEQQGQVFEENGDKQCKGGVCGV